MNVGWGQFPMFAIATLVAWGFGGVAALASAATRTKWAARLETAGYAIGAIMAAVFIATLWVSLGRPPFKTLGETRLWYAVLLPTSAFLVHARWGFRWLDRYCVALAAVFIVINLVHPEAHDKTLAPALQSGWFVPHVVVYLIGYALLGASFLVAMHGLVLDWRGRDTRQSIWVADHCVLLGFVFLTGGLVFGGIWAKEAWGHYWTWDPKETWSFLTWITYLGYLHLVYQKRTVSRVSFCLLLGAFALLLVCWFGVNYLPAAASSVHAYSGS